MNCFHRVFRCDKGRSLAQRALTVHWVSLFKFCDGFVGTDHPKKNGDCAARATLPLSEHLTNGAPASPILDNSLRVFRRAKARQGRVLYRR